MQRVLEEKNPTHITEIIMVSGYIIHVSLLRIAVLLLLLKTNQFVTTLHIITSLVSTICIENVYARVSLPTKYIIRYKYDVNRNGGVNHLGPIYIYIFYRHRNRGEKSITILQDTNIYWTKHLTGGTKAKRFEKEKRER